jgi:dynein heavy chain
MAFITMNPGYIGRAELPESLKALFRPVSMAAPDLALIAEIMLLAEGFRSSRALARKFVALYSLCEGMLSAQRHYDWRLRAIKTTLYVAGGMRRAAPDLAEERVLLRALRDFNLGKLAPDDAPVFAALLEDLFPGVPVRVPRALDAPFEARARQAALELGYQTDATFLLKVSQLREIFAVRWSVFLLGPAGCGKTAVWRTLQRALQLGGDKALVKVVNPKAVTRDELYGALHPATREWREGLLSAAFREMAANAGSAAHQWIVLDGDIDPEWIESMNTVMDDNKVLTLASNERIPLAPSMRLLLEINHMDHCSPATVSRGGVVYVGADDVGWRPAAESWLERRCGAELHAALAPLFERYVERALAAAGGGRAAATPLTPGNMVETLCKLLEGLLGLGPAEAGAPGAPAPRAAPAAGAAAAADRRLLDMRFAFAAVWAFGGALAPAERGGAADARAAFAKRWAAELRGAQAAPFPPEGTCFDYYVDVAVGTWAPWARLVAPYDHAAAAAAAGGAAGAGAPLDAAALFVPTADAARVAHLLALVLANGHSAALVGGAGTGKSALAAQALRALDPEAVATARVGLSAFHDAAAMQAALEAPLERQAGARYGAPGGRRLALLVDDLTMPAPDKYATQGALELLRQAVDHRAW